MLLLRVGAEFGAYDDGFGDDLNDAVRMLDLADNDLQSWAYWQFKSFQDITTADTDANVRACLRPTHARHSALPIHFLSSSSSSSLTSHSPLFLSLSSLSLSHYCPSFYQCFSVAAAGRCQGGLLQRNLWRSVRRQGRDAVATLRACRRWSIHGDELQRHDKVCVCLHRRCSVLLLSLSLSLSLSACYACACACACVCVGCSPLVSVADACISVGTLPLTLRFSASFLHCSVLSLQYNISTAAAAATQLFVSPQFYYPSGFNVTITPAGLANYTVTLPTVTVTHSAAARTGDVLTVVVTPL